MSTFFSKENLEKLTIAILPVIIFMLVSFIFDFYKKSISKTGVMYNVVVIILSMMLIGYFKINIVIIFLVFILGITIYTLFMNSKSNHNSNYESSGD